MDSKRWWIAGTVAGLLVFLAFVWAVQGAAGRAAEARGRWQDKIGQLRVITKDGTLTPSTDLLRSLGKQRQTFAGKLNNLLALLKKSGPVSLYNNALEFKGDLFNVQRLLLSRANALGIEVPPSIGFEEFTGREIPPAAKLESLSFQLAKIKEFLGLLIDCPVGKITLIERGPSQAQRIEPDEEIPFCQEFVFRVNFLCTPEGFKKFLSHILGSNSLFVLENLNVSAKSDSELDVQVQIKAVTFSETKKT